MFARFSSFLAGVTKALNLVFLVPVTLPKILLNLPTIQFTVFPIIP